MPIYHGMCDMMTYSQIGFGPCNTIPSVIIPSHMQVVSHLFTWQLEPRFSAPRLINRR